MRILAGIETEYGLYIEGRGAEDQIDDSMTLVRTYPNGRSDLWDYRFESPRSDIRGFEVDRLAEDPIDAQFDTGRRQRSASEVRSDQVLRNGARFYNDHGHPEYSTGETWSLDAFVKSDQAGELAVLAAARAYEEAEGHRVRIYKNNTDYHGASYGTHESYLVPRRVEVPVLVKAITPILIARTVFCGAGKVGSEIKGETGIEFQLSQRADHISEPINVETLYRRPIFNTRDEPHADGSNFLRLHVISGDANMLGETTKLKAGLIKLAITQLLSGKWSGYTFKDPVQAFKVVGQDLSFNKTLETDRGTITAIEILQDLCTTYSKSTNSDLDWVVDQVQKLSSLATTDFEKFARHVDWAAKYKMLGSLELPWDDPAMQSYDLEYHNVDPEEGLTFALAEMGEIESRPADSELEGMLSQSLEPTRARARGIATEFKELRHVSWRTLVFLVGSQLETVDLDPRADYSSVQSGMNIEDFIATCRNAPIAD